jgi:hypothetical protein
MFNRPKPPTSRNELIESLHQILYSEDFKQTVAIAYLINNISEHTTAKQFQAHYEEVKHLFTEHNEDTTWFKNIFIPAAYSVLPEQSSPRSVWRKKDSEEILQQFSNMQEKNALLDEAYHENEEAPSKKSKNRCNIL